MEDSNNLNVKINTSADTAGIEKAREEIGHLTAGAGGATEATKRLSKSTEELNEHGEKLGFRTLREAAHAAHGVETAFDGGHMSTRMWINSLRGLYELLIANPWTAALTVFGSVAIAIGTWAKKTAEARAEAAEEFGKIVEAAGNASAEINKAAADLDYEELKSSLDEIKDKYDAIKASADGAYEAQNKLASAETALKLAKSDVAEQDELREAGDDPKKQLFIRQKYAAQRLNIKNEHEADDADRALKKSKDDAQRASEKKEGLEGQRESVEHLPDKSQAEVDRLKRKLEMPSGDLSIGLVSDQNRDLSEMGTLSEKKNPSLKDQNRLLELQLNEAKIREEGENAPTYNFEKKRLTPIASQGDIMARNQLMAIGELEGNDKIPGAIKVAEEQKKKSEAEMKALDAQIKAADTEKEKAEFEIKLNSIKKETVSNKASAENDKTSVEFGHQTKEENKKTSDAQKRENDRKLKEEQDNFQGALAGPYGSGAIDYAVSGSKKAVDGVSAPSGGVTQASLEKLKETERNLQQHGASAGGYEAMAKQLGAVADAIHHQSKNLTDAQKSRRSGNGS